MTDIHAKRRGFDGLGDNVSMAADTTVETDVLAGVNCHTVRSSGNAKSKEILLYLHGGCFTLGSFKSHGPWVSHLVQAVGRDALFIDYSLAPETPYPAGSNDITSAVAEFMETNSDVSLIVVGDSAGGGLLVTVMPKLVAAYGDRIKACILISPWVDLNCSHPSFDTQAHLDPKLSQAALKEHAAHYQGTALIADANPMERLNNRFPPTLIFVGSDEVLLDDAKLAHDQIRKRQENCTLKVLEGETHVWVMDDITSDASVSALTDIALFIGA